MEGIDSSSELNQVICRFLLLRLLLWKIGAKRISVTQEYPDAAASSEQINVGNWESLPGDVQDRIVAALPFQQVLQFRSISKAFQDILRRPTFLQPRLHRHATEGKFSPMTFFLDSATSAWQWLGFDLMSNQWKRLPSLSFLATPDANLFKEFLFTGNGGLICANVSKNPKVEELIICNPLTRATRKLPPLNFPRQPVLMNLLLDKDTNNYKIIVAGSATIGSEELSRKTEVYNSMTREWKVVDDIPGPEYALNEFQTGAISEGVLYCVGFISTGDRITHGLLAYHIETEKWLHNWECTLPHLPCCQHIASNTTQIFESEGSIFVYWEQEHSRTIVHFCVAKLETRAPSTSTSSSNSITSWTVVVSENKAGSRGLLVYPEYLCIGQGPGKVCIFNTLDLTGFTYKIGAGLIGPNIASPLPEPLLLLERASTSNNLEMQGGGSSDSSSTNSTGRSLFFSSNSLNFAFEPSFHTPV